jgi:hypothetical protein
MNKLTTEQYAAAHRMIDEEVIGGFGQHKGKILDSWYDKLASVLQFTDITGEESEIPTEDEIKGRYIGVPGVAPEIKASKEECGGVKIKSVTEYESELYGHYAKCGADITQPDIPYAHTSVAGNIMPGHTDTEVPQEDYLSRLEKNWHSALNHLLFSYPKILKEFPMVPGKVRETIDIMIKEARKVNQKNASPKEIEDLLWHDDEYESKDKHVNDRLIEAYRRGKDSK